MKKFHAVLLDVRRCNDVESNRSMLMHIGAMSSTSQYKNTNQSYDRKLKNTCF